MSDVKDTNGSDVVKRRPGPAPKPKVEMEDIKLLLAKIHNLEKMVSKLSSLTGNRNLSIEFGIIPWDPDARSMRKYN